jgi:hypothetical protein
MCHISLEGNGKRINRRGTTIKRKGSHSLFVDEMEELYNGEKDAGNW